MKLLSNAESTTPVEDSIAYEVIKHLPEAAKIYIENISKGLKISLLIPVKKPN